MDWYSFFPWQWKITSGKYNLCWKSTFNTAVASIPIGLWDIGRLHIQISDCLKFSLRRQGISSELFNAMVIPLLRGHLYKLA